MKASTAKSGERRPQAWEPDLTDEQLLVGYCKTGNRDMFAQLVKRYERELYSYLRRFLGSAEWAEDVFQAAFLQIHLKCNKFEEGRRFRPWLYTIATNQAIDAQRSNRRHRMVSLDQPAGKGDNEDIGKLLDMMVGGDAEPSQQAERSEQGQLVRDAIDELPEGMKAVVHLVYFQGMKYREAAEVLSVPVGTVKSRVHSAILKLTEHWNETHVELE